MASLRSHALLYLRVSTPSYGRHDTNHSTAAPPPPVRQTYNNSISGLPSHWIPFYGSAFGLFYDPLIDMFVGDGPPRRSVHRPRDRSLPSATGRLTWLDFDSAPPCAYLDDLHVQPLVLVDTVLNAHLSEGESRFFCFCIQTWVAFPHRCPSVFFWPLPSAVVPPRGWLPGDWICRDIPVKDKGYLGDEQMAGLLLARYVESFLLTLT